MTGTPIKDRAEAYREFRDDARLAISRSTAVFRTMKDYDRLVDIMATDLANAHFTGFAEGMKRAAEIAHPPLMHRKGNVGLWRQRRKAISDAILAEISEAK